MNAARIAAWRAVKKYTTNSGKAFSSYVRMKVEYAIQDGVRSECGFSSRHVGDPDGLLDQISSQRPTPKDDSDLDVAAAVKCLWTNHRVVIEMHYLGGFDFAEIGRSGKLLRDDVGVEMSRERVRQIHDEAIGLMRNRLTSQRKAGE